MGARERRSRILVLIGGIAMLVGAVDPMEGSLLILPGSGMVALGTYLGGGEGRSISYAMWSFIMIVIGVGALWGLSAVGGFGGAGRSYWWGVLILPYLIGWSMGIWGAGSPRWISWLGIAIGAWYLTILLLLLGHPNRGPGGMSAVPGIVLGAIGALTIGGCVYRLTRRVPA